MKLTQEQLAALIARVFANLIAAGKDPASIGTEDILSELAIVLDSAGEGGSSDTGEEDGSKAEGGKGEDDDGAVPLNLLPKLLMP